MPKGKKASTKPSLDETVKNAVETTPGATTLGISGCAGISRSTAGRVLGRLADAGELTRHPGGRDRGKRLPDRWTLATVEMPAAFAGHVTPDSPTKPTKTKPSKGTKGAVSNTRRASTQSAAASDGRLKPGGLEPLVIAYLKKNASSGPHGPATVAKALERSSGAVANCLIRLADSKKVRQVSDKPRRYSLAA